MIASPPIPSVNSGFRLNLPPGEFRPERDLPAGFLEFLEPLHRRFTPWQRQLAARQKQTLAAARQGRLPQHLPPSEATTGGWRIELPDWCADQRNQMTGPGDDAELCVKLMNSGSPGVLLDFEDSTANEWQQQRLARENILGCLRGTLRYFDKKRGRQISIQPGKTVVWIRPRGLHMSQGGIFPEERTAASLFDMAGIVHAVERDELRHPLCFYVPKAEAAEEALWWRDVFQAMALQKGWPRDAIKCMALVESHPLAHQMEEFMFNLRDHILGLNLGRWDYMASLIDYTLADPEWVLPDRNTIPHDVPFFQRVRELMPELCHKRGILAEGGMTALYPSREDPELNARALKVLAEDKGNESRMGMDGAWTGHPDQNEIAVNAFPAPNQLPQRWPENPRYPDLRPKPLGVGAKTVEGTRAAVRTVIRYRNGVVNGKGASLLDGYMEDLATDRIYRLMIAQRMKHGRAAQVTDATGSAVEHAPDVIARLFDEELEKIIANPQRADIGTPETFRAARRIGEEMILSGEFSPL
jgi:malate synthase